MPMVPAFALALAALAFEAAVGYPAPLYKAIGHPVTWIGRLISRLDAGLNHDAASFTARRRAGIAALVILLTVVGGLALLIQSLAGGWAGWLILVMLASSLLAQRSLHEHVQAVAAGLDISLEDGRHAVAMIVGRRTADLDEAGVIRAAMESLAENFSDGVVAPAFWLALGGLPGCALYKAVNTADSMIGHRTPRHEAFGWAAARFDDLVNLPASRLTALWLIVAAVMQPGASAPGALVAVRRDAGRHRSPNAGWPEAAMAGALGVSLGGPRIYGDAHVDGAFMGDGRSAATRRDLADALALYRRACLVQALAIAVIAIIVRG